MTGEARVLPGGSASLGGPSRPNYPWLYPWHTLPIIY